MAHVLIGLWPINTQAHHGRWHNLHVPKRKSFSRLYDAIILANQNYLSEQNKQDIQREWRLITYGRSIDREKLD